MPILIPEEPYARAPNVFEPDLRGDWDGGLDVEDGIAIVHGVRVTTAVPLDECRELHLIDCEVEGLSFLESADLTLHVTRSALSTCDLSQIRLETLESSSVTGSKLFGTDLAGAQLSDSSIRNCTMRYLSLRMATLERVAFDASELTEIDLYDSTLHDMSFDNSRLEQVSFDRCQMSRVDFRSAEQLGLVSSTSMKGSIISENQVLELAYQFAMASGVDIEPNDPDHEA